MDTATKGLTALAIAVWVVAGYFALRRPAPPAAPSPPTVTAAAPPPSATATATAPPEPRSPSACMAALMPPDTFSETPSLEAVCTEAHPFRAFTKVKSAVVGASGPRLTQGARELAGLGWYELAAVATMRARCCPAPVALEWPFSLACPMDRAMTDLEKAIAGGDEAAIDAAVEAYRAQAVCLYKFGQGKNFGRDAMPGSERTTFEAFLARAR